MCLATESCVTSKTDLRLNTSHVQTNHEQMFWLFTIVCKCTKPLEKNHISSLLCILFLVMCTIVLRFHYLLLRFIFYRKNVTSIRKEKNMNRNCFCCRLWALREWRRKNTQKYSRKCTWRRHVHRFFPLFSNHNSFFND